MNLEHTASGETNAGVERPVPPAMTTPKRPQRTQRAGKIAWFGSSPSIPQSPPRPTT